MKPTPPPPVLIEGIPVHPFTVATLHDYLGECVAGGYRARVLHVNVNAMNLAHARTDFRRQLVTADAVFCDGEGVRWAARLLGQRLPARITYADWLWQLAAWAEQQGVSLYFAGAEPGVAAAAAERLMERFPRLLVAGTQHGFWRRDGRRDEEVVEEINAADPDVLVLGLGMPLQEIWLGQWWDRLVARVGLTGGACFDYVSGRLGRAPRWMLAAKLEWLYRLGQEPRRLFRRYVLGNPRFLLRILAVRLFARR